MSLKNVNVACAAAVIVWAIMTTGAASSSAQSSNLGRADGGKTGISTRRTGTVVTVYSKVGVPLCSRSSPITDHAKAIAKYKNMKC